jgi:HisJ family histidinol phosphate phosphatase
MKFDSDLHIHTVYARHSGSDMTVPNVLNAAASAGLRRVVVLEHFPEIGPSRPNLAAWRAGREDRSALEAIKQQVRESAGDFPLLEVLTGVEVDADPFAMDGSAMLDDSEGLDVVIGATHIFPGGTAFWYDPVTVAPDKGWELAHRWRQWVLAFLRAGRLDVLAHPGDLVAAGQLVPPFDAPETLDFFEPILETMAENKVAFELNELLARKLAPAYRETYPLLVNLARDQGLLFSICSDAHFLSEVGRFAWVRELVSECGLTERHLWQPPTPPLR